jgi:hypothetical protein
LSTFHGKMDVCPSGYEFEFGRTAKFCVLRIVQGSNCPITSTTTNNCNGKSSSNSDSDGNLFDNCSARTDLEYFTNVNSMITNKSSANELDMDTSQEKNDDGISHSGLDIYNLSITKMLSVHGCCILGKFFRFSSLETVKLAFNPIVKNLTIRYNEVSDEFDGTSIFQLTQLLHFALPLFSFAPSKMFGTLNGL